MPTYEYKCTECNERFEVEQSIHDDPLTTLPGKKHEHQLKKVFSPVGIAFKGDGFYRNDARVSSSGTSDSSKADAPTKVSKADAAAASGDKKASGGKKASSDKKASSSSAKSSSNSD